jgi:hypothetical protein
MKARSTLIDRDATNPYLPTMNLGVTPAKYRLASSVWSIVVPTAVACVVGSIFFRSYFVSVGDPDGGSISTGMAGLFALPFVLFARSAMRTYRYRDSETRSSNIVADGYERALDGIEAEVRLEIEDKYANQWNSSGLFKRWLLLRRIEREVVDRVAERAAHISPDSLF